MKGFFRNYIPFLENFILALKDVANISFALGPEKTQTLFQSCKILLQSAILTKTKVKKKHKIFVFNLQMIYPIYLAKNIEFIFLL